MERIKLNIRYVLKNATEWTVRFFALLGLIGTFASLSDILDDLMPNITIYIKIIYSIVILCVVWFFFGVVFSLFAIFKNKKELVELNGGKHIYAQYGDVFSDKIIKNKKQKRIIVIPANRCFDVFVDNELVSDATLHGQALNRLYLSGQFTEQTINEFIQNQLKHNNCLFEMLTSQDKRRGNLKRYEPGTVVEIEDNSNNCIYFFMGLSKFDYNLKASTSEDEYVLAMMRLLEYIDTRSEGRPVVMPLIGGGLSRTRKAEENILGYIQKLVEMHTTLLHGDLHIVVRASGDKSISINNL